MFSLVARLESIRILIAIVAQANWELHHLDVKTTFLNEEITKTSISPNRKVFYHWERGSRAETTKGLIWPKTSFESLELKIE